MTVKRTKYEFKTIQETSWLWTDLSDILTALKTAEIKALNLTSDELSSLAFNWDLELDNRYISPLLTAWENEDITTAQMATFLATNFKTKWNMLYDALEADYNPIENYSMVEDRTVNGSTTDSSLNGTTQDDDIYAYDSETPSHKGKVSTSTSLNGTRTDATAEHLTRSGNIGITTSQQMIESEIQLRKKILLDMIRDDIVGEITIPIFEI